MPVERYIFKVMFGLDTQAITQSSDMLGLYTQALTQSSEIHKWLSLILKQGLVWVWLEDYRGGYILDIF